MERQISENELKHVDLGGTEIAAEGRENADWAAMVDSLFAERWDESLRELSTQALRAETNEAGLKEACRRIFREGFSAGRDYRDVASQPAATPPPGSNA